MAWRTGKKTAFAFILFGAAGLVSAAATDIIPQRQRNMKQMGGAFKALGEELKKPAPSMAVIQTNAVKMQAIAPHIESWFPQGSGPEAGVKTKALPAIWTQKAEFHKDAVSLAQAVDALVVASKTGNAAQVGAAAGAVGNGCKTCHTTFKQRGD